MRPDGFEYDQYSPLGTAERARLLLRGKLRGNRPAQVILAVVATVVILAVVIGSLVS